MNKANYLNYGHNANVQRILDAQVVGISDELEVRQIDSPMDAFLRLVYAPDPISKLPVGDLMYCVNDKANPEVRDFVLANLQMDTSSAANIKTPNGVSDEDLIALTRSPKESVDAYAERVNMYMYEQKRIIESLSKQSPDVPSQSSNVAVSSEPNIPAL